MKLVYNPGGKEVKLAILGKDILIPSKRSVVLDKVVGENLQDLLPGLEYSDFSEEKAEEMQKDIIKGQKEEARKEAEAERLAAEAILYEGMTPEEIEKAKEKPEKKEKKVKAKKLKKKK